MKIVILGAGESGIGAALLAKKNGADVFVSDYGKIETSYLEELKQHSIPFEEETHSLERILSADLIIKSPGIPNQAKVIQEIAANNIEMISEIEYASRYTKGKIIAITGSNGKTTTTNMIFGILQNADLDVAMVGNVGISFARMLTLKDYKYFVIEVSSFQLDNILSFKPHIAILTNLSPDHLDRYNNEFEAYTKSKFRIIENQQKDDVFIYFQDDDTIAKIMEKRSIASKIYTYSLKQKIQQGAFLTDDDVAHIQVEENEFEMNLRELGIQGKHNASNTLAASIASSLVNVKSDVIKDYFQDFQNLEHRMEHTAYVRGIEFLNDSKATNVNSVWFALESMTKPVIWIAGGVDKGNDYEVLLPLIKTKVKALICLGKDNSKLLNSMKETISVIKETQSMKEAVEMAYSLGQKGDVVLLSPACASFDLFKNYEDRGHQFKEAVRNL